MNLMKRLKENSLPGNVVTRFRKQFKKKLVSI